MKEKILNNNAEKKNSMLDDFKKEIETEEQRWQEEWKDKYDVFKKDHMDNYRTSRV